MYYTVYPFKLIDGIVPQNFFMVHESMMKESTYGMSCTI